jgi:hypothetical protein
VVEAEVVAELVRDAETVLDTDVVSLDDADALALLVTVELAVDDTDIEIVDVCVLDGDVISQP